jgi:DNA-directed RNA polymerase specialized sigma24 family protein
VPLTPESGTTGSGLDPACDGRQPEDQAVVEEQRRIVEECIADLPEDYRELIVLRDYVGASWETIAAETGRPSPDAARMKHATAMVELAKRVQRSGGQA